MAKSNSKQNICAPAMLYLIIALLSLITMVMKKVKALTILVQLIFIAIYTLLLNLLCKNGYTTISWILVILPFIIFIIMILFVIKLMKKNNVKENFSDSSCIDECNKALDDCMENNENPEHPEPCIIVQNECMKKCSMHPPMGPPMHPPMGPPMHPPMGPPMHPPTDHDMEHSM